MEKTVFLKKVTLKKEKVESGSFLKGEWPSVPLYDESARTETFSFNLKKHLYNVTLYVTYDML